MSGCLQMGHNLASFLRKNVQKARNLNLFLSAARVSWKTFATEDLFMATSAAIMRVLNNGFSQNIAR
jgi:hypothetical protein